MIHVMEIKINAWYGEVIMLRINTEPGNQAKIEYCLFRLNSSMKLVCDNLSFEQKSM